MSKITITVGGWTNLVPPEAWTGWLMGTRSLSTDLCLYNSVQMFEPFQDWNPHFFGTISLTWFVTKSIPQMYDVNLFLTKSLRKTFLTGNLDFCGNYFQFLPSNCAFRTYLSLLANMSFNRFGMVTWGIESEHSGLAHFFNAGSQGPPIKNYEDQHE